MNPQFFNDEELSREKNKLLGRIWGYSELEMHEEAIAESEKLIKFDPDDASSYIELGLCYEENEEIEKAIKCYKLIMKRFPKDSRSYINLGHVYERRKKRDDMAMVCYEKAFELNPGNEWAINNIGAIIQKKGRWRDALNYYEKAYEASKLNREPNNSILHNLAWAHYHCKNYNKAMGIYHWLAQHESDNAAVCADLGCVKYKAGAYYEAFELFGRALSLCPNSRHYQRLYRVAVRKQANESVRYDGTFR